MEIGSPAVETDLRQATDRPGSLEERLLPLLQQLFPSHIDSLVLERIKTSSTPATVYRARLKTSDHAPASLLVKLIEPEWPEDPPGPDREVNVYTQLLPYTGFEKPRLDFAGCLPASRQRLLVLEDLHTYRVLDRTDRWAMEEARCFVRVYARLHSRPLPDDEALRSWLFPISAAALDPARILEQAAALVQAGRWAPLPGLEALLSWTLETAPVMAALPQVLNHNDVFPPNILLPPALAGEAVLVDWEMAGIGLPEMDLAFMFLQPFRSAAALDRAAVLAGYWEARRRLDGAVPPSEERLVRQRFADAVWGLYLVGVAHRSVARPFPPGTPAEVYWQSMRPVVHEWLHRLAL